MANLRDQIGNIKNTPKGVKPAENGKGKDSTKKGAAKKAK